MIAAMKNKSTLPMIAVFLAAIFAQDEAILLLPAFWLAALGARGFRWLLRQALWQGF